MEMKKEPNFLLCSAENNIFLFSYAKIHCMTGASIYQVYLLCGTVRTVGSPVILCNTLGKVISGF